MIFSRRFNQFEVEILHRSPGSLSASRLLSPSLFGRSSVTAPLFPLYNIYGGLSRHRDLTRRSPPCLLDIQPTSATNAFCPNTGSPCRSRCLPCTDVQVNLTQGCGIARPKPSMCPQTKGLNLPRARGEARWTPYQGLGKEQVGLEMRPHLCFSSQLCRASSREEEQ